MSSSATVGSPEDVTSQLTASRESETSSTPHNDKMGTDMVKLYVGPEKTLFMVHKRRLCRRIPFFDRMFNGHFKETVDQEAFFPVDNTANFDILIEWVYNFNLRKIREMVAMKNEAGEATASWDAVNFYHVAEKFMLPELQDMIMGSLLRYHKAQNQLPSLDFIRRAYDETSENGKLRLYAGHALYYVMKQANRKEEIWPMADIEAIIQGCDGACRDFLKLTMKQEVVDPRTLDRCYFHLHGEGDICPMTGKRYGVAQGDDKKPDAKKRRVEDEGT